MRKLLVLLALSACTVTKKKLYTEKELSIKIDSVENTVLKKEIDTVIAYKDRIVTKEVDNFITLPIDCDTTGNVKNLRYQIRTGNNKLKAVIENNQINISLKIDSTIRATEKHYQSKYEKDRLFLAKNSFEVSKQEKSTEVVKTPWSLLKHFLCYLIILALLSLNIYQFFKHKNPF